MTSQQKKRIRLSVILIGAIGLLVPVTVSPNATVQANDACAGGGCCRELLSVCITSDSTSMANHYRDSDGICGMQKD